MTTTLLAPPVVHTGLVDVADVLGAACVAAQPDADGRRLTILQRTLGDPRCETDAHVLEWVLRELLLDAISCSERGESIDTRVEGQNDAVLVSVTTHAVASNINPGRVLAPFIRRADPGVPESPLREARRQVERLGGRLRASCDLGRCTTFTVSLPRERGALELIA